MKHILTLLTTLLLAPLHAAEPPKGEPTNAAEAAAQDAAAKKTRADTETEAKYQALVAALPPDQQAWERTLQENLGGFYLPIHKRRRVEGGSASWDFVQDDPKLPRVLLIGDSVSGGYTLSTRKALTGKTNVHKAPENCGPTANGLKKLDIWLGDGKWDIIHFNFGLHDSKTPTADYESRLREIVARLKKTGANLIWASTTPRPADGKEGPGLVTAVIDRNEIATRVMKETSIAIDDLYTAVLPHLAEMQNPKDVHFNSTGYEFLGNQVAAAIEMFAPLAALHAADAANSQLWDPAKPMPKVAELATLPGARFSVIKPYEFAKDGYRFLHGVALCFHKGRLYASFGHNKGGENTDTEEARWTVSDDEGRTWSAVKTIDAGMEPGVGVSHGAFLSHDGKLWAFHGAYRGIMKGVHTRAYVFDEKTEEWQPKGTVIEGGFWPMQQPIGMADGNWIMAGLKVGEGNPALVAISHGGDLLKWDVVTIPATKGIKMWGESTVIVKGRQVTSISRYGAEAKALAALSEDCSRTWSEMTSSNLPMTTSKPCAGLLSNGQRYLVCTTTADSGERRSPLTIAVTKPGDTVFSKVFLIRDAVLTGGPDPLTPRRRSPF